MGAVLVAASFTIQGIAFAQTRASITPHQKMSPADRGHAPHQVRYSSDKLTYYTYQQSRGIDNHVIVHHGAWENDLLSQRQVEDVYKFGPTLEKEIKNALIAGGAPTKGRFSTQHYFDGFSAEAFRLQFMKPSNLSLYDQAIYDRLPANGSQACLRHQHKQVSWWEFDFEKAVRTCQAKTISSHPLAPVGFIQSSLEADLADLKVYKALSIDSKRWMLVLEHKKGPKRRACEDRTTWSKPIPIHKGLSRQSGRVCWSRWHLVGERPAHLPTLSKDYDYAGHKRDQYGISQPALDVYPQYRANSGDFRNIAFDKNNIPSVSLSQTLQALGLTAELAEARKSVEQYEVSEEEQKKRIAAVKQNAAQQYGHIWKPNQFWDGFRALYKQRSGGKPRTLPLTVQRIFDGDFSRNSKPPIPVALFKYLENMAKLCPSALPANAVDRVIISQVVTYDPSNNEELRRRETGRHSLRIDPRFNRAFERHFESNEARTKAGGYEYVVNGIIDMFRGGNRASAKAAARYEPAWGIDWFFSKVGCDSPELKQLGENMLRLTDGRNSVQADRLAYDGRPQTLGSLINSAELLFQENTNSGFVRYAYGGATRGWLPETPDKLLAKAEEQYGPTVYSGAVHKDVRTMVRIDVVGAAAHSLESMHVATLGAIPYEMLFRDYLKAAGFIYRAHAEELNRLDNPPKIVECTYRNGHRFAFWLQEPPAHMKKMFKAINGKRSHCPDEFKGPSTY